MYRKTLLAIALGAAVTVPVAAEQMRVDGERVTVRTETPGTRVDGANITITGRVIEADPDSFTLDYGTGEAQVAMNGWSWYTDPDSLVGQQVTVRGALDQDWLDGGRIEADSLYVAETHRLYHPPSGGNEVVVAQNLVPVDDGSSRVIGRVTGVDSQNRMVHVESGALEFSVDVSDLGFNPAHDGPYQLREGDRIIASGHVSRDRDRLQQVLDADTLVILTEDPGRDAIVAVDED